MINENPELVSVIIPTYNRINEIIPSIESVLSQDYPLIETIIVDDGSSDGTMTMLEDRYGDRLRYLTLEGNHGCHFARNEGIKISSGQIIAFNDSDDRWHSDKLKKQMDYWKENPDCVLIYAAYETTRLGKTIRVPNVQPLKYLRGEIFPDLLRRNTIGSPTIIVKKDFFYEIGGFDDTFPALEDWEFVLRASQKGPIGYLDEILVDVNATEGGISSSTSNYYEARCKMLVKYYEELKKLGLLDTVMSDILNRAENSGLLEPVKQMLLLHLSEIR